MLGAPPTGDPAGAPAGVGVAGAGAGPPNGLGARVIIFFFSLGKLCSRAGPLWGGGGITKFLSANFID